jgi:hypothetical protein
VARHGFYERTPALIGATDAMYGSSALLVAGPSLGKRLRTICSKLKDRSSNKEGPKSLIAPAGMRCFGTGTIAGHRRMRQAPRRL